MGEPLIVSVIHRYHPEWSPPNNTGRTWIKTTCPFHGDTVASAAVSYEHNAFGCLGCPAAGNAITLITQQEGVSYSEAKRLAQELAEGGGGEIPLSPSRKRGRVLFEDQGTGVPVSDTGDRRPVPSRIRRRTF